MLETVILPEISQKRIKEETTGALDDRFVESVKLVRSDHRLTDEIFCWDQMSKEALVSPKQVSERLLLSQSKLAKLRCSGTGPRFVKLGRRTVAYRIADVEAYIHQNLRNSTSGF